MLIHKLLQFLFNDHLCNPVRYCWDTQDPFSSISIWDLGLSDSRGVIASACKPVPYRVKVFPRIACHSINSNTINAWTFTNSLHTFESFPDFRPLDWLRLLFLFKDHPQFSLSCNTKRNHSCEALRSFPVSGDVNTITASSAPDKEHRYFRLTHSGSRPFSFAFPYRFLCSLSTPR